MTRRTVLVALTAAGCSQNPAAPPPPAESVVAARVALAAPPQGTTTLPVAAQPPKPPEPPPTVFEYPTDLGGRAVVRAVTPSLAPLAVEKTAPAPKPRTPPARVVDPDPVSVAKYVPPPVMPPKPGESKPTPPPERVPYDLGYLADAVPERPTFPVKPGITQRAADVKVPPALPVLGRPATDRVGLDDPTAEAGNQAIVAPLADPGRSAHGRFTRFRTSFVRSPLRTTSSLASGIR
ncbi:unnamed protein product [Gemmataceae bacterium]|nr:unnamed protein product [Gemmataceae bacterium]VTU00611.1 unnamed protein product [Gemmataceae bacterium]